MLGERHIKQASAQTTKIKGCAIRFRRLKALTDEVLRQKKQNNASFDLAAAVHESEEECIRPEVDPGPDHRLKVTLEPDDYTDEKYELFANYQSHVHHEGPAEISKSGFKRFLCSSPVQRRSDASGKVLGSHHHCYRLDGRLIAMAVLDLLPHAVSGVYFVYHSDFEKWSLGKLSALREAALALERGYEYYYMGYYIHSCAKMHYKGTYKPQYVLDFESFAWDPLDDKMRALMEKRKYVSMARERSSSRAEAESATDATAGASASPPEDAATRDPYPPPLHPVPVEAANSGLSLIELGMPGVLTLSELKSQVDLDHMRISLGRGGVHHMQDIVSWDEGSETDSTSIKGIIAEMAACLGPDLAQSVVVDFTR